jgi:nitrate reductase delta subunit
MRTLKILGFFLTYPEQEHIQAADECAAVLQSEKWLSDKGLEKVLHAVHRFKEKSLLDLQEDYVALFDRTPSLSLHFFVISQPLLFVQHCVYLRRMKYS